MGTAEAALAQMKVRSRSAILINDCKAVHERAQGLGTTMRQRRRRGADDPSRAFQNRFPRPRQSLRGMGVRCGSSERSMCDLMHSLRSWPVFAHAAGRESLLHPQTAPTRETLSERRPTHLPHQKSGKNTKTRSCAYNFHWFLRGSSCGGMLTGLMSTPLNLTGVFQPENSLRIHSVLFLGLSVIKQ